MVAFTDRAVVPAHVLIRHMDGEAVLLSLDTETYFGLDTTATRMWELVTNSSSIGTAYGRLAEEFDVEPEILRDNLIQLLGQLVQNGLLKVLPADVESAPSI